MKGTFDAGSKRSVVMARMARSGSMVVNQKR